MRKLSFVNDWSNLRERRLIREKIKDFNFLMSWEFPGRLSDCLILQDDINMLGRWWDVNRLKLNVAKCSVFTVTCKSVKLLQHTAPNVIMGRVTSQRKI